MAADHIPDSIQGRRAVSDAATSIIRDLPEHLAALQTLVNRCPSPELKKELIVTTGCCGAISPEDGFLIMTANQLETA